MERHIETITEVELTYGHISQAVQVLEGKDLNTESLRLSFPKHMQNRIDEKKQIQSF